MEYSQLNTYEWLGQFKYPDGSLEFPGKLTYSCGRIKLEFLCGIQNSIRETPCLHGTLASGEICTLIGKFDPTKGGACLGKTFIYNGCIAFSYLIIGKHLLPDQQIFSGICINYNLLQDFCYPEGFKKDAKFCPEPIHSYKNEALQISITMVPSCLEFVSKEYGNRFISDNKEIQNKIVSFFANLIEQNPKTGLYVRNEVKWLLQIMTSEKKDTRKLLELGNLISELFSILLARPVHFIELSLKEGKENNEYENFPLLVSMANLSEKDFDYLKQTFHHECMPITPRNVELSNIFLEWFKISEKYSKSNFARKIRYDFNDWYYVHQTQAEFVLLLTQLEDICNNLAKEKEIKNERKIKYTYPIEFYDQSGIVETLNYLLNLKNSTKNIGEKFTALRAEIAHLTHERIELKKLPDSHLLGICKCIDIIIISHIYKELKISWAVIKEFQESHLRSIKKNFLDLAGSRVNLPSVNQPANIN